MNEITSLVDNFKKAGIQAQVTIVVDAKTTDVVAIKALQTSLKNAGITPEIHILVYPEPVTNPPAGTGSASEIASDEQRAVHVKEARLNCFTFRKTDKAGKPIMEIREPRIQLLKGAEFFVSTTHKISPNDTGNGITLGTGNIEFYFVVDCPPNPAAVGLYVRKVDIE
jgi:hypothetical protein